MKVLLFFVMFGTGLLAAEGFTHLKSDHMHYEHQVMVLEGNVELKGDKGDVSADLAYIPFSKKEGALDGNVAMKFPTGETLTCDSAEFDLDQQIVHFTGQVSFSKLDGSLLKADRMLVKCIDREIQEVKAFGDVTFERQGEWQLLADTAVYDKGANTIVCSSNSSVSFNDAKGRMYAKGAVFDLTAQECILEGDVKMIHREGPLEQWALAEKVILSKEKNQARFYAQDGRRVLFYDRINKLQMSAPQIDISKDPVTNQDTVKGVGKVRFHFKDEEYERLRQYFMLEKMNG